MWDVENHPELRGFEVAVELSDSPRLDVDSIVLVMREDGELMLLRSGSSGFQTMQHGPFKERVQVLGAACMVSYKLV